MLSGGLARFWGSFAIVCGTAGVAAAEPSPLTLWWEPPKGSECPSGDVVLTEVERLLGGKPNTNTDRRLFARAKVSRRQDGSWELLLRTVVAGAEEEAEGERTLHAPSCEELANAAALIVALGFDPAAVAARAGQAAQPPKAPGDAGERDPSQPKPTNRALAPTEPPPAPTESVTPIRPLVWLGGGVDLGSFEAPSYALQLRAGLRHGRLQLAASVAYFPPLSTTLPERPTAGGTFALITGGLLACGSLLSFRAGLLELAACGGAEIGQMSAKGFGVASPGSAEALWLAARAGGALTAAITRAAGLRLDLGLAAPIARNRFYMEEVGIVQEPSYVCGRADIGIEMQF